MHNARGPETAVVCRDTAQLEARYLREEMFVVASSHPASLFLRPPPTPHSHGLPEAHHARSY